MNPRNVTTQINADKCVGCKSCIKVCPSDTISIIGGIAVVTGDTSLSCGHCMAVCPAEAIIVKAIDPEMTRFDTFEMEREWMPFKGLPTPDVVSLMASRRSCRNYKDKPVEQESLKDLIKTGALAPSGTNSQEWTYTCFSTRETVLEYAGLIKTFFQGLNKKAENPLLRKGLKLVGVKALDDYYKEYYESVSQAMEEMETHNRDRLFHGASACILIGTSPNASCPKEDAMLAAGNIQLAAHTMGLGSCLIGFAVAAMKADASIQKKMGIPSSEKIHAVVALGYPDETYKRITGRKTPVIRFK